MLNTEEQSDASRSTTNAEPTAAPTGSQYNPASERVTTDEFTAALRAIESRKLEESQRIANTVEVGKTIQDLNIDATPDEVMREVLAQRNARQRMGSTLPPLGGAPPQSTEALKTASREQLNAAASMLKEYYDKNLAPGRVQIGVPVQRRSSRRQSRPRRQFSASAGIASLIAVGGAAIFLLSRFFPSALDTLRDQTHIAHATYTSYANLANGQTGYIGTADLNTIIENGEAVTPGDKGVLLSSIKDANTWEVFKSGSNLYLKGFVTDDQTRATLQSAPVHIYSQANGGELAGEDDKSVVLPLNGIAVDGMQTDASYSEITLDHIQLDVNSSLTSD